MAIKVHGPDRREFDKLLLTGYLDGECIRYDDSDDLLWPNYRPARANLCGEEFWRAIPVVSRSVEVVLECVDNRWMVLVD